VDGTQLKSDDEIAAARIGQPEVLDAPITLAEYDPTWPVLYKREAVRIRAALRDRALLIEHVGSTAVPRLAAKPRIDIVLAVADSSDEASYVPALETAGYVLHIREPSWYQIASSTARTRISTSTSSRKAAWRSSACCGSAITCGATKPTASSTRERSAC
jgi:GrpB-like predicted nucleotidyltransferase (UPF0157 family)